MATGREGRDERMAQRLRGAQRTNVGDESFSFDIAGLTISTPRPPVEEQAPSSSAKRRRLNDDADVAVAAEPPSDERRVTRSATKDVYDLPDSSKNSIAQSNNESSIHAPEPEQQPEASSAARTGRSQRSSLGNDAEAEPEPEPEPDLDAFETLQPPPSLPSPARRRISRSNVEEIEESPVEAPESGRRRSVPSRDLAQSSTRLHNALYTDDGAPLSSSPLVKKSRRSDAAASIRPRRSMRESYVHESADEEADELSPNQSRARSSLGNNVTAEELEPEPTPAKTPGDERSRQESEEEGPQESEEEAEEIGIEEAAQKLGRKRPRISPRRSQRTRSPELGSSMLETSRVEEPEPSQVEEAQEEPQPKRRRRQQPQSPAVQKQPAVKPKKAPSKSTKSQPKSKEPSKPRRKSGDGDGATIEITVQRFINNKKSKEEEPVEGQTEIPYANRGGESVVDVFAQVCEEVTVSVLAQLQELAENAPDAAKKKEYRVKTRAVEAYKKELRSRLLEHTLQLDHWHSLRKRVRHAQREKIALREEILRLKAEREQVALQMDEIRIKHEADSKEATHRLNTSSLMNDIDLAVAQGIEAPELSRTEKKLADLGNLELLVSRIVDEASSASSTGGLLNQVRDFNAFLERAAVALETK